MVAIATEVPLSSLERQRYQRHLTLPEVGEEGQLKLKQARVLVIGAGGLGSPASLYLASAGVGTLGLVDFDKVSLSNLQRQILFSTDEVGQSKVDRASERLRALNPEITIKTFPLKLSADNIREIFTDFDMILDASDNFSTRYLVNDACVLMGKPNIHGSIHRFDGQLSVFDSHQGPCYRCLYPAPPKGYVPNCAEGGVLGVLPGIVGSLQALEAIKLILGQGETLIGQVMIVDALGLNFHKMKLPKDPSCQVCGEQATITKISEEVSQCNLMEEITVQELKELRDTKADFQLLDVRQLEEYQHSNIGGIHIPLAEVSERHGELDKEKLLIVHCKMGGRSARAVEQLQAVGFTQAKNLQGGITAWSNEIDPDLSVY